MQRALLRLIEGHHQVADEQGAFAEDFPKIARGRAAIRERRAIGADDPEVAAWEIVWEKVL